MNDLEKDKNVLPADFDGIFRFTNWTENEFKAKWANIEYTFPPLKTTPMIIAGATPEEVQSIRKKFARELAISEFYKTPKFIGMNTVAPGGVPALYTDNDLAPFIQKCLEPLPIGKVKAKVLPKVTDENSFRKDEEGRNVTEILDRKRSLLKDGSSPIAT